MLPDGGKKRFAVLPRFEGTGPDNSEAWTEPQLNCIREIFDTS